MTTQDTADGMALIEKYPTWRRDEKHMALGSDDLIYMHPLPAESAKNLPADHAD